MQSGSAHGLCQRLPRLVARNFETCGRASPPGISVAAVALRSSPPLRLEAFDRKGHQESRKDRKETPQLRFPTLRLQFLDTKMTAK